MFGTIAANAKAWPIVAETIRLLGVCAGPDDVYLALRGRRTLSVRLAQHIAPAWRWRAGWSSAPRCNACCIRRWKATPVTRSGSATSPALPGCSASCCSRSRRRQSTPCSNALKLFGMGFSWGGFESLAIPFDCSEYRTATPWAPGGPTLRLHIGLEDVDDLKADFERGFAVFNAA